MKINRFFKVFISIVLGLIVFFAVINVIPPKKVMEDNPFIIEKEERTLIAAHRGGKNLNPENTFKAINYSFEQYNIDILEMDVCLTKDGHLVLNHNLTINACSDVEIVMNNGDDYYIKDHNLNELQVFNFGYNFKNKDGLYPYRNILDNISYEERSEFLKGNDLRIVTVEELFEMYSETNLMYIIEIKDSGDIGYKAVDELITKMKKYNLMNKVAIGTFHDEIEQYIQDEYPTAIRGASEGTATVFIATQMFKVNLFDNSSFACLQIPTTRKFKGIKLNLVKESYINRAHRRGISVQYWTINEKEEMRELIQKGADVIMTDNPDILYELLNEMGY